MTDGNNSTPLLEDLTIAQIKVIIIKWPKKAKTLVNIPKKNCTYQDFDSKNYKRCMHVIRYRRTSKKKKRTGFELEN